MAGVGSGCFSQGLSEGIGSACLSFLLVSAVEIWRVSFRGVASESAKNESRTWSPEMGLWRDCGAALNSSVRPFPPLPSV